MLFVDRQFADDSIENTYSVEGLCGLFDEGDGCNRTAPTSEEEYGLRRRGMGWDVCRRNGILSCLLSLLSRRVHLSEASLCLVMSLGSRAMDSRKRRIFSSLQGSEAGKHRRYCHGVLSQAQLIDLEHHPAGHRTYISGLCDELR